METYNLESLDDLTNLYISDLIMINMDLKLLMGRSIHTLLVFK